MTAISWLVSEGALIVAKIRPPSSTPTPPPLKIPEAKSSHTRYV